MIDVHGWVAVGTSLADKNWLEIGVKDVCELGKLITECDCSESSWANENLHILVKMPNLKYELLDAPNLSWQA